MLVRINSLSEIYGIEKDRMIEQAKKTKEQLMNSFEYEEERWRVVLRLKVQEEREMEADAAGEFFLKFEDMMDRLQTQHDKIEGYFESALIKMWQSMQKYFHEYQQKITERRKTYDKLLQLDIENSSCIKNQANRIQLMTRQVQSLKEKLNLCEKKYEKEIGDLKAEREEYVILYKKLRNRLSQVKSGDSSMQKDLAFCCHEAENKLGKAKDKAGKILTLAQMCRALETEEEKILLPKTFQNDETSHFRGQNAHLSDLYLNAKIQADSDRKGTNNIHKEVSNNNDANLKH
ncbi:dynein regulatory complex subunit 2-like [Hetaerina americana]|uniref:dynein regulatory complex subunit 2-like n=1 Tax=Hetaerina americana TaxID=62018 RepID=UPI003A7F5491